MVLHSFLHRWILYVCSIDRDLVSGADLLAAVEWVGYIGVRLPFPQLSSVVEMANTKLQRAIGSHESPNWSVGPYIQQSVLILVAPALFAASMYMELGRIIRLTDGAAHSVVSLRWLTKIFVCGDVFSFLMQASGQFINHRRERVLALAVGRM